MAENPIRYACSGCGAPAPEGELPFRCPNHGGSDDVDHLLERTLEPSLLQRRESLRTAFEAGDENPFVRYRQLLWSYHAARGRGMSDGAFVELVRKVDARVREVDGRGIAATPFRRLSSLADRLGVSALWVKDETGQVAGAHKARHLMGVMIALEVERELDGAKERTPLAIASCGNAALAAAVVARAAGRSLQVFVPEHADAVVVAELERHGADLVRCRRQRSEAGDPSYLRFREAVEAGALPFTCQGPENGLVIEGGQTMAFEMVSTLLDRGERLDRIVVQVGGGALASAVTRGFAEARALGLVEAIPRLCTVQTEGASPLARAYDLVAESLAGGQPSAPAGRLSRAAWMSKQVSSSAVEEALRRAAAERSSFMWPWEEEPRSIATGILDDETYDWRALVAAMLETGGVPVVVSEDRLKDAHNLAASTGIDVEPTGSAGLAGCLELSELGELGRDERVAVLFTGVTR